MIVYSSTKKDFINDVMSGYVDQKILTSFVRELGHSTGKSEMNSWKNSMPFMSNIVNHSDIPDNAGIAIEYKVPQTSKRIDFIITGKNADSKSVAVLIELKQWSEAELTDMDGIVMTFVGGRKREVSHPSYQVWSYATLLEDYNSSVQNNDISMIPCAYLHNYNPDNVMTNTFYNDYIKKAPIFLRPDALKLQDFLRKFVKYGDDKEILYTIDNGKIRPSKSLSDNLSSMLEGNQEFILLDDQKIVYETALKMAEQSTETNKNILLVEGGPGTGKSVVAINLLVELTKRGKVVQYVTKNSAPREVYQVKLSGKFTKTRIANLFSSSGSFYNIDSNTFDVLIIDEAHRLNAKSGLFSHLGDNQIKELINAAKCCIFLIDEDQRVTIKDIGEKSEIINWANQLGVNIVNTELLSQFRCNGSNGYISWLDNILQIKDTANETLEDLNYDFKVFDDVSLLHQEIVEKNKTNNKSRMVAGYCWKWASKNNVALYDIEIGDYRAKWNLNSHGQAWIVHPDSVSEIGCIHTCQGLELDYVGVIIGEDFVVRDGQVVTDAGKRASTDQSMKGIKKKMKENKSEAEYIAGTIIKNTYRTLMTRGMKGCYIYCTDKETANYFKEKINNCVSESYGKTSDNISFNSDKSNG